MRVFSCPAKYQRFVESSIALALADIGRDVKRRAEGQRATVHRQFIDDAAEGELVVLVGVCTPDEARQLERVAGLAPRRTLEPV